MRDTRVLVFPPFRLDLGAERLGRDTQAVRLTAKAFAVLRYLVAHAGQLVTKDERMDAVWTCPAVSETALTVCIGEIRRALGETARTPQFLETVRGRTEARLLLLGTYRPAEAVLRGHPIHAMTQELQRQGQGLELWLGARSADGVQAYLAQRFGALACPQGLVHLLHQRTSGNPFFLVTVVDELVRQGTLVFQAASRVLQWDLSTGALGVPQSVRQLIEQQLAQVGERAQTILDVASVVGLEFSAGAVAAVVGHATEDVEACCDTLARRGQWAVHSSGGNYRVAGRDRDHGVPFYP